MANPLRCEFDSAGASRFAQNDGAILKRHLRRLVIAKASLCQKRLGKNNALAVADGSNGYLLKWRIAPGNSLRRGRAGHYEEVYI
jgi:hypothetical protein